MSIDKATEQIEKAKKGGTDAADVARTVRERLAHNAEAGVEAASGGLEKMKDFVKRKTDASIVNTTAKDENVRSSDIKERVSGWRTDCENRINSMWNRVAPKSDNTKEK